MPETQESLDGTTEMNTICRYPVRLLMEELAMTITPLQQHRLTTLVTGVLIWPIARMGAALLPKRDPSYRFDDQYLGLRFYRINYPLVRRASHTRRIAKATYLGGDTADSTPGLDEDVVDVANFYWIG